MKSHSIKQNLDEAKQILDQFVNDQQNLKNIESAGLLLVNAIKKNQLIISCGNGGSMCDAMHFAEELTGRFKDNRPPIAAIAISDASHITCVANDYGFDFIFERYIDAIGKKDDVLLAISTSGNSKNILLAAEKAKQKKMKIIGLTGKDGGALSKLSDIEIRAPFSEYSDRAQEIHIKVIHCLIDFIEKNL
ncbi:MAG: D-sedoheptulose 7-phosphate isomerase [Vicingaceae bacterium]